jgi:nucleotide-binding universal stress UspA family protein
VSVVLPPVEFGTYSPERTVSLKPSAFERREAEATNYLSGIMNTYANELAGISTEIDVTAGAASSEIYSEARLEHVDLIVLSSKGEMGLKRWVFGSLAQEVIRLSHVPVLVLQE